MGAGVLGKVLIHPAKASNDVHMHVHCASPGSDLHHHTTDSGVTVAWLNLNGEVTYQVTTLGGDLANSPLVPHPYVPHPSNDIPHHSIAIRTLK